VQIRALSGEALRRWDEFAGRHALGMIYHNSRYSRTLREWGHEFEVLAAEDEGEIIAGAVLNCRPMPLCGWRSANIEGGVLLVRESPELLSEFVDGLLAYLSRRSYVDLRLFMRHPRRIGDTVVDGSAALHDVLVRRGLAREDNEIGTYVVDIDRDEEALIESFGKNCRRDVRKAQREGVTVDETDDPAILPDFYEQYVSTYRRKGLTLPLRDPFIRCHAEAMRESLMRMYYASFGGKVVNMALIARVGTPRYMKGASIASEAGERMPPTGQVLHFEIMRRLRADGFRAYDLGGCPGPEPIEGHANYWVWRFKHAFGGAFHQDLGEYYTVLSPLKHRVLTLARTVHGRIGHVRASLAE